MSKKQPTKQENRELEAQRQAEEQKRQQQEEQRRREEDERRYRIVRLETGLELILTEWCIQEGWSHQKPRQFIFDYLTKYFKEADLIENFETLEIEIISEFHLYNLIFAKDELLLDNYKTCILLNILWILLKNNNSQVIEEQRRQSQPRIHQGIKTIEDDFQEFKKLLLCHSIDNPPNYQRIFNQNQVQKILRHVEIGYFEHFNLYKYIFTNKQMNEEIRQLIIIDLPLCVPSLSEALFMGHNFYQNSGDQDTDQEETDKLEDQENVNQINEEDIDKEQDDKKRNSIDQLTLDIIQQNIKVAEDTILKQLDERDKHIQTKIEETLNPKTKTKK